MRLSAITELTRAAERHIVPIDPPPRERELDYKTQSTNGYSLFDVLESRTLARINVLSVAGDCSVD